VRLLAALVATPVCPSPHAGASWQFTPQGAPVPLDGNTERFR